MVVLGREVPAEPAHDDHREQRQPDEDVSAVEPGQTEEDGRPGARARVEADVQVLDDLRQQEREPHQEREHHARRGSRRAGLA